MAYLFKGKLLKLKCVRKRLPNGFHLQLEYIEHPGAVLIVPFLDPRHLIFIRQFRPAVNAHLYELPAGTLNPEEDPVRCARRELTEETGYQSKEIRRIGKIFPVPGYSTEVITIFTAKKLLLSRKNNEPDEIIQVKYLNRQKIRSLFRKGLITDAKTICSLAFIGWL